MSDEEVVKDGLRHARTRSAHSSNASYDAQLRAFHNADEALSRILSERDSLRQRLKLATHAAGMVENPEYVKTLQDAGVEYVEQLVTTIDSLRAALHKARFVLRTSDFTRSLDALVVIDAALDKEKG